MQITKNMLDFVYLSIDKFSTILHRNMKNYLTAIFSLIIINTTTVQAQAPSNLDTSNIGSNNATLSWTDNNCGTFIKLRYKMQSTF